MNLNSPFIFNMKCRQFWNYTFDIMSVSLQNELPTILFLPMACQNKIWTFKITHIMCSNKPVSRYLFPNVVIDVPILGTI